MIRFLKPEEEKRLRAVLQRAVDACGPQNERRHKRLLHRIYELDIALGTGMRKDEQYGLTWPDIDFDRRVITLRNTKNQSGQLPGVPICTTRGSLLEYVCALRNASASFQQPIDDREDSRIGCPLVPSSGLFLLWRCDREGYLITWFLADRPQPIPRWIIGESLGTPIDLGRRSIGSTRYWIFSQHSCSMAVDASRFN